MKWFKHDGNAMHDAKLEKLIMKYGIEGYGLYFACIEIIAGALAADNITFELEHDAEVLAYKFKVDTLRVEEIMKYCVELGLFQFNQETGKIMCLALAKRLDVSTSNNPEVKKIINGCDYQKLLVTNSRLDKIRLDEIRVEKKETPKSFPIGKEQCSFYIRMVKGKHKNAMGVNFCMYMCEYNWCRPGELDCFKYFNAIKEETKEFKDSDNYFAVWTNKLKDNVLNERGIFNTIHSDVKRIDSTINPKVKELL